MSVEVKFDYDIKKRKGILVSSIFNEVREYFSVKSPKFGAMRYNRHIPDRKYVITPTGRFDIGLYWEIYKYVKTSYPDTLFTFTEDFKRSVLIKYDNLVIDRSLRDYQNDIVHRCLNTGTGTVLLATAGGKAQPLYCKIKIPTGWTTMGEVKVGDNVLTPTGSVAKVIGLYPQGKKEVYRITFDDGRSTECCDDHLWKVYSPIKYDGWESSWNTLSTKELIKLKNHPSANRRDGGMNIQIPLIDGDITTDKNFAIHPYVVGCLLGGSVSSDNKFIPDEYLTCSFTQRIELLQGLLDAKGYIDNNGIISIDVLSEKLAHSIVELVRSIGGISSVSGARFPTYRGIKDMSVLKYTVSVIYSNPIDLFKSTTKRQRLVGMSRDLKLGIKSIEKLDKTEECQCIMIDSKDHLYVTDDYIVTHNTFTMASLVESISPTKCIIIVPDPGLVEQTYNDFIKYGINQDLISKWTGTNALNLDSSIIIANRSILQSKSSNIEWVEFVDLVIVDEVQTLKKDNGITDIVKRIRTPHKYGFTGTLPESNIDRWTIMGITGPVIYERKAFELRKDKYVAEVKALILKLDYVTFQENLIHLVNPNERYRQEIEWLVSNKFRNNFISKLCGNFTNNCLLLVDRIEHGKVLYESIKSMYSDKQVYFISGEMDVESREKVKKLMEANTNVVCIAISKIFAVGISINNLHYIVFCSGGKSRIRVIQSIGRGLRLHQSKSSLTIIDIADQLKYGILHSDKRKLLYNEERIPYIEKEYIETTS